MRHPMAVVFVSLLFWPTMGVRLSNLERLQTTAMPLCDASIVQETCDLLTGEDGSSTVTAEQLQKLLVSNEVSTSDLWRALHFDLNASATCQSVCDSIVDVLNKFNECPPSSDVGCILDDNDNLRCDIDLSPEAMKELARITRGDMPDFHDSKILDKNKEEYQSMGREINDPDIFYGLEEVVQRTANLFRIYPRELDVGVFYAEMQPSSGMELNGSTFVSAGCLSTCYDKTYCTYRSCKTCAMCQTRVSTYPASGSECASYCSHPSHCVQYPSGCGKCSFCKPYAAPAPPPPPFHVLGEAPLTYGYTGYNVAAQPVRLVCETDMCWNSADCVSFPKRCNGCSFCQGKPLGGPVVAKPMPPPPPSYTYVPPPPPNYYYAPPTPPNYYYVASPPSPAPSYTYVPAPPPAVVKPVVAHKPSWRDEVKQRNLEAQAYVNTAIRSFNEGKTSRLIRKWFGRDVDTSPDMKQKVQKALNSVNNMLGKVEYVYPGDECEDNTYAYVYPHGPNTRDSQGRFLFFLCDLYMRSPKSVQIETLTHEGSHHAVAYLDDVKFEDGKAYGRDTCERLAIANSYRAIQNADSFCYYVQDVTDDSF